MADHRYDLETSPTHRISWDMFSALARGGGGPAAIHQLRAARRSKNLALIRSLVHLATAAGHPEAALARQAYLSLSLIQHHTPHAVATMLDYPSVGVWAVRTTVAFLRGDPARARPGQLAAITASAAVRGGAALSIELPAAESTQGIIALPSLGSIHVPGPARGPVQFTSGADGATLAVGDSVVPIPANAHQDSWCWQGIRKICAEYQGSKMEVLLDTPGCYPLSQPITTRRTTEPWQKRLTEGWEILVRQHSDVAAEIAAAITVLVPLSPAPGGHTSATFNDAFGCIAMSLPADGLTTAATLAHEVQHNKLAAFMDLFPLLTETSDEVRFYAPWRDDPRHIRGLLHGLYAYLGVTAFWRQRCDYEKQPRAKLHAQTEFLRWRDGSHQVADVLLNNGKLTEAGEHFIAIAKAVLGDWRQERIPAAAAVRAERIAAEHRQNWNRINGEPDRYEPIRDLTATDQIHR